MLGSGVIRMGDLKFYDPEKATKEAIEFYELQVDRAKRAVFAWSLVGIRLNLIKDVRVLIAKTVWEMKREGNYEKIAEQRRRSKR